MDSLLLHHKTQQGKTIGRLLAQSARCFLLLLVTLFTTTAWADTPTGRRIKGKNIKLNHAPVPGVSVMEFVPLIEDWTTNRVIIDYKLVFSGDVDGLSPSNFDITNYGVFDNLRIEKVFKVANDEYRVRVRLQSGEGDFELNLINSTNLSSEVNNVPYTSDMTSRYQQPYGTPVLLGVTATSNNADPNIAVPGNTISVTAIVSYVASIPQFSLSASPYTSLPVYRQVDGQYFTFNSTYTLTSSDTEGPITATATGGDVTFNNELTGITFVKPTQMDFTAPVLSNFSAAITGTSGSTAYPGNTIGISFTSSEPLDAGSGFSVAGKSVSFTPTGSNNYSGSVTLSSTDPEGGLTLSGVARDAAGNTSPVNYPLGITFDHGATVTSIEASEPIVYNSDAIFYINFSEAITGLTASNLNIITNLSNAEIIDVMSTPSNNARWRVRIRSYQRGDSVKVKIANSTGLSKPLMNLPYASPAVLLGQTIILSVTNNTTGDVFNVYTGDVITIKFKLSAAPVSWVSHRINDDEGSLTDLGDNTYELTATMTGDHERFPSQLNLTTNFPGNDHYSWSEYLVLNYKGIKPVAVKSFSAGTTPTNAETVNFELSLPEEVTGFTLDNFTVNTTGDVNDASVGTPTASGNDWIIPVNTGSGDGTISLTLANSTGLSKTISNTPLVSNEITIDKTPIEIDHVWGWTDNEDEDWVGYPGSVLSLDLGTYEPIAEQQLTIGSSPVTLTESGENTYTGNYTFTTSDTQGPVVIKGWIKDAAGNQTNINESVADFYLNRPVEITDLFAYDEYETINSTTTIFEVSFSGNPGNLTAGNFRVSTASEITGAYVSSVSHRYGNNYRVYVNTGSGDGWLELSFDNDEGMARVTNASDWTASVWIDKSAPELSNLAYTTSNTDPTRAIAGDVITFTFTASESIWGDFTIAGRSVSLQNLGGNNYRATLTLNGTEQPGNIVIQGSYTDGLYEDDFTEYTDIVIPEPGIDAGSLASGSNRTNQNTVNYTISFPEEITGVTASNFELVQASGVSGASIGTPSKNGNNWTVPVSTGTGNGTILLRMVNDNGLSTKIKNLPVTGNGISVDKTAPSITTATYTTSNAQSGIAVAGDVVTMSFTASESLSPVPTFTVAGTTDVVMEYRGGFNYRVTYTVKGTETPGQIYFAGNIADNTGNTTSVNQASGIYYVSPVTISGITRVGNQRTNATSVDYTVTFSNTVEGLGISNFDVRTAGIISGTVTSISGSGTTYTVTIGSITGNGTIFLRLANSTGIAQPITNTLPYLGESYFIDQTAPVVTDVVFATSNADPTKAVIGDVVSMNFTVNESLLESPVFTIAGASGNSAGMPDCTSYTVTRTLLGSDDTGPVNFTANVTDLAGNTTTINQTSGIIFSIASSNNNLSNLFLDSYPTLGFNQGTVSYSTTIPFAKSVKVVPTSAHYTAAITVNGNAATSGTSASVPVTVGNNVITVSVTAQNGDTKDYTINITVEGSPIATLGTLELVEPAITKAKVNGTNYRDYTAATDAETIKVLATAHHSGAVIRVNGEVVSSGVASQAVALTPGENIINTVVTSEDGTTINTYRIVVTRAPSNNANLSGFELVQPAVVKAKVTGGNYRDYTATVEDAVSNIKVLATTSDAGATIKINGAAAVSGTPSSFIALNPGANTINVEVTAANGVTINTYSVVVTRKPSSNAFLSNLALDPDVAKAKVDGSNYRDYTATVASTQTSIKVIPSTHDAGATIMVNGFPVTSGNASAPIALAFGANTINTVVTAADGVTSNTYSIVITRALSNNTKLQSLTVNENSTVVKLSNTSYVTSVSLGVNRIRVKPLTEDKNATVTVNGTPVLRGDLTGFIDLADEETDLNIQVTAPNGTSVQNYVLSVNRAGSNNVRIKNIKLNPNVTVTSSSATTYSATVPAGTDSLKIRVTPEHANASITVNSVGVTPGAYTETLPLYGGTNAFTIVVTAEDGLTKKTYTLNVRHEAGSQPMNRMAEVPVTVSSALSPNGDGYNDVLLITGIEAYPDNTLQVMNSKGTLVNTVTGYDNHTHVFDGRDKSGNLLPQGTYFYMLQYKDGNENKTKSGYVVLKY